MDNPNIHELLSKLKGVKSHDGYWTALCPAHEDTSNSLSVTEEKGNILLKCHTGCATKEIIYSLGMAMKSLFPKKEVKKHKEDLVATYDYFDDAGALVYQVCRLEWDDAGQRKKTFRQRRPDGKGGFTWKTKGLKKVLYRLQELMSAPKDKPVFIIEGEKAVDCVRSKGLIAVCNTGGAGKWMKTYGRLFTDRDVIIVPDADAPDKNGKITGASHAVAVANNVLDFANTVHVLQLPNCETKWGLDDWLEKGGHSLEELKALLADCPQWPEGEVVTEVPPEDDQLGDPIQKYEDLLKAIGITYCAHTHDGYIEIFSTETRRFRRLNPSHIKYEELIAACGLIVIRKVQSHSQDSGDIPLSEIRAAIAAVSSVNEAVDDKRGQGCWAVDEHRIAIVNKGELAILNGRKTLHRSFNPMLDGKAYAIGQASEWIDFDLLGDDAASQDLLYQSELDELVGLMGQFKYRNEYRQPELLAGLILASIVQSCWPLRPQVFLIGQSYSGKTTIMMILEKMFGAACRKFSQPTAAALRAFIQKSSMIALLDEVEKSRYRNELFELIRASARGDTVIRSSAGQQLKEYSVNNIFWAAAIEPGVVEEADKTRFILIELEKTDIPPVIPETDALRKIGDKLARLAICTFRQAMALLPVFSEARYSEKHGRLNECFAIPAAAYAAARGLNEEEAVSLYHDMMRAVDADEDIENDQSQLLQDILDAEIRNGSTNTSHLVHECLYSAHVEEKVLETHGIKKDMEYHYFNRNLLKKALRDEKWKGVRLDLLLLRFDGAFRKSVRMGVSVRQVVAIPNEVVKAAAEGRKEKDELFNPFEEM